MADSPYIDKTVRSYNPQYGDDRICKCGHRYYRHFDSYEDNEPVGCKYCECHEFEEAALDTRTLVVTPQDLHENDEECFLGIVKGQYGDLGIIFPPDYVEELGKWARQMKAQMSEYPGLERNTEMLDSFIAISSAYNELER